MRTDICSAFTAVVFATTGTELPEPSEIRKRTPSASIFSTIVTASAGTYLLS